MTPEVASHVSGWHILEDSTGERAMRYWDAEQHVWCLFSYSRGASTPEDMSSTGWKYIAFVNMQVPAVITPALAEAVYINRIYTKNAK